MQFGGFLNALGGAFRGYGHDQDRRNDLALSKQKLQVEADRIRSDDARQADVAHAQTDNYHSQIETRRSTLEQERLMRSPEFEDTYVKARNGDLAAQAKITSMVAGHSNAAAILAPFTRVDPVANATATHAANRNYDLAHPSPADARSSAAGDRAEAAAARAERSQAETGVRSANRDYRSMLTHRPRTNQFTDPLTHETDTTAANEALTNWRSDSTETAGARADATARLESLLHAQPAGGGAPAPAKMTLTQSQYDRAIGMGKSDAEIKAAYDVPANVRRKL